MKNNIEVNVTGNTTELVIREGQASPIELPNQVTISGNISTPRLFLEKRKGQLSVEGTNVQVNKKIGKICLFANEKEPRGTIVVGVLEEYGNLKAFQINGNKKYGLKELTNFLRMNRRFFKDKEVHAKIIDNLSLFEAKVNAELKIKDDRKGNTLLSIEKKVSHEVPLRFIIESELFEGQAKVTFNVEILAEVTDASVAFWLESVELAELLETQREKILDEEVKAFAEYVVVEV